MVLFNMSHTCEMYVENLGPGRAFPRPVPRLNERAWNRAQAMESKM
jgi:hypothetical protein